MTPKIGKGEEERKKNNDADSTENKRIDMGGVDNDIPDIDNNDN